MSDFLHVRLEDWMLKGSGNNRGNHDLTLIVGESSVHVSANSRSAHLLAGGFRKHRGDAQIKRLGHQIRSSRHPDVPQIKQRLQIVGLGHPISHQDITRHF